MLKGSTLVPGAIFAFAMLLVSKPAYAYIDPGTGSVVTTAVLGFVAAAAYTFRKYMYRIKDLFSGKKPSNKEGSLDR